MRVAALDQGTNTTRLLVADVDDGRLEEIHRESVITRLGEGVDERRRLLPVPLARVRNVLSDYRRTLESLGARRTLLIATSAVRDAENGEAFLGEVEWSYGFETRLLTGHEEALMTLRGVTSGRRLDRETLIVDLGGGSTELVVGGNESVRFHDSVDVGSVRLTERFLHGDPPTDTELAACRAHVRRVLAEQIPAGVGASAAVGVAGTITTLAALDLELPEFDRSRVHRHVLTPEAVARQLARLAAMPVAERRQVQAMNPDRAPVIVAGAVILREVLAHFALDGIEVSERDILDGAALAAAELPAPEEGAAPPGAYTCC